MQLIVVEREARRAVARRVNHLGLVECAPVPFLAQIGQVRQDVQVHAGHAEQVRKIPGAATGVGRLEGGLAGRHELDGRERSVIVAPADLVLLFHGHASGQHLVVRGHREVKIAIVRHGREHATRLAGDVPAVGSNGRRRTTRGEMHR